jgi:hypothetical protein
MSSYGTIALKLRYLGDTFVGQDLCRCKIDVGMNAISIYVYRGHTIRRHKWITNPAEVELLKAKLRVSLQRMKGLGRWKWTKTRAGVVYIEIYYPHRSWAGKTGQCRLFSVDGSL